MYTRAGSVVWLGGDIHESQRDGFRARSSTSPWGGRWSACVFLLLPNPGIHGLGGGLFIQSHGPQAAMSRPRSRPSTTPSPSRSPEHPWSRQGDVHDIVGVPHHLDVDPAGHPHVVLVPHGFGIRHAGDIIATGWLPGPDRSGPPSRSPDEASPPCRRSVPDAARTTAPVLRRIPPEQSQACRPSWRDRPH